MIAKPNKKSIKVLEVTRIEIATQLMAAMITGARLQDTIPNADMIAEQAIAYTDALIKKLTVEESK